MRSHLPKKEFKAIITRMLTKLGRRTEKYSKNFSRVRKYKKNESELKNTITQMKNSLEGLNSKSEQIKDTRMKIRGTKCSCVQFTNSLQLNET